MDILQAWETTAVDFVKDNTGLAVDRARFIICILAAYPLGLIFSVILHPKRASPTTRHLYQLIVGLLFCFFCFKSQVLLLLGNTGMCYLLLLLCPASQVHIAVFVWAMSFMSVSHIYRMYTDYNGYTLDFTGPTMIITMKVTALACSVYDGVYRKDELLSADQKNLAVRKVPSLIEYLSYIFSFTSILSGPSFNLVDYTNFISGADIAQAVADEKSKGKEPSGILPSLIKFVTAVFFISLTFVFKADFESFFDTEWRDSHNKLYIAGYLYLVCFLFRCQYYFTWIIADSISNISGFGFNGYTADGAERWDKITNAYPLRTETSSSLKLLVENWNVGTALWLRRVCYERSPISPTVMTYILSATWHGFYPGYYGCFLSLAFFIMTSRKLRRVVRPHFLSSPQLKMFYDVLTTVCSVILVNYSAIQQCLLSYERNRDLYLYFYFAPHIICAVIYVFCPAPKRALPKQD